MNRKIEEYEEQYSTDWTNDSIRLILTPSQKAKLMYFYIQEIGCFKTLESYFTQRKNLHSFLLIYTVEGMGTLQYEGKTHFLEKGSIAYIDCRKFHRYEAFSNHPWEFFWVHFDGIQARDFYQEYEKGGFQIQRVLEENELQMQWWRMIALSQKKNITTELQVNQLLHFILSDLLIQNTFPGKNEFYVPLYIDEICKYIQSLFAENITLEDCAKLVNRSKFHVAKEFKKYMGVTINEYQILERMARGKELLKYSDLPIAEIATRIGIQNTSHFINLFRDREHVTPLNYRKLWRDDSR